MRVNKAIAQQRLGELQAKAARFARGEGAAGERADGKDGTEALQRELMRTLTDLAHASTEV